MTCVIGAICDDGRILVVSDAAISHGNGERTLMPDGKWWDMGCLLIGESGSDFALSRIRQKTMQIEEEEWETLRDPYTFSNMVCEVQNEIKGELEGADAIEAELLHVSGKEDGEPLLHKVGGDGGITGPFPYAAVGCGTVHANLVMDTLFDKKRCKGRSMKKVREVLFEALERTAQYNEGVSGPFFEHIFDPKADFQAL